MEEVKKRLDLLKQEQEKLRRLEKLRSDTLRKVEFLNKKAVLEYHEVYLLIKEFFKEFLEKRYEFTMNELRQELKKVYISNLTRGHIATVLEMVSAGEYATVHYSKADLIKILSYFREIVQQLIQAHTSRKSLMERFKSLLFKDPDPQTIISELPVVEGGDSARVRLYTLIERCYEALDKHNLGHAKSTYEVLLQEYEQLDEERKDEHYHIVHQTYQDMMNRSK
jgi:hypothetical protein